MLQQARHLGRLVERQPVAVAAPSARTELHAAIGPLGNEPGHGRDGSRHDRLRRLHVLLEQQRRDREHVADLVEPVTRVVGRKLLLGLEVEPRQVADRVAILDPVEPADRDATRIGFVGIDLRRRRA